jgi:hypothetical protein
VLKGYEQNSAAYFDEPIISLIYDYRLGEQERFVKTSRRCRVFSRDYSRSQKNEPIFGDQTFGSFLTEKKKVFRNNIKKIIFLSFF